MTFPQGMYKTRTFLQYLVQVSVIQRSYVFSPLFTRLPSVTGSIKVEDNRFWCFHMSPPIFPMVRQVNCYLILVQKGERKDFS